MTDEALSAPAPAPTKAPAPAPPFSKGSCKPPLKSAAYTCSNKPQYAGKCPPFYGCDKKNNCSCLGYCKHNKACCAKPCPEGQGCKGGVCQSGRCVQWNVDLKLGGWNCAGKCINENIGYDELGAAWQQCGKVAGCARIMKYYDGKYYLRSNRDLFDATCTTSDTKEKCKTHFLDYTCKGSL